MAVRERAPIGGRAVGRHNKKPLAVARLELDVGRAPPQTEPSVATRLEVESGAAQSAHCVHSAHCAYSANSKKIEKILEKKRVEKNVLLT